LVVATAARRAASRLRARFAERHGARRGEPPGRRGSVRGTVAEGSVSGQAAGERRRDGRAAADPDLAAEPRRPGRRVCARRHALFRRRCGARGRSFRSADARPGATRAVPPCQGSGAGRAVTDEAARRGALDPTQSFIVQAPAGSGKTELLIRRYLVLLATVEEPEQIVAITFTRKAAAEMRNRVVAALQDAADGAASAEPHRATTLELARSVLQRGEKLGWSLTS